MFKLDESVVFVVPIQVGDVTYPKGTKGLITGVENSKYEVKITFNPGQNIISLTDGPTIKNVSAVHLQLIN